VIHGWGICGTGKIAGRFATALRRVEDAHVVGVASRSQERADAFAAEHGADRAHGSLDGLLQDPAVHIVYLASPHSEHCREALQVVEAGKHVLVEKPFGLSLAEVEPVLTAAEARGVFLMEAMWSRFLPAHVRLRELVAEGAIGQVRSVEASVGSAAPFVPSHRVYDPVLGGGALLDIGIYAVDVAVQLLGAPPHVVAEAALCPTGVDVNTLVAMRWDDGAVASAHCSLTAQLAGTARVIGTEGWIEIPDSHVHPDSLTVRRFSTWQDPPRGELLDLPVGGDGLRYQVEEVHRCLEAGRTQSSTMSWRHSRELMGTLDRARAAFGLRYPGEP
jgi:predicted dehydrogenase